MGQLLVVWVLQLHLLFALPELIPDPLWYGLEGDHIYNGSGIRNDQKGKYDNKTKNNKRNERRVVKSSI